MSTEKEQLTIRLSADELERIRQEAYEKGLSANSIILFYYHLGRKKNEQKEHCDADIMRIIYDFSDN